MGAFASMRGTKLQEFGPIFLSFISILMLLILMLLTLMGLMLFFAPGVVF